MLVRVSETTSAGRTDACERPKVRSNSQLQQSYELYTNRLRTAESPAIPQASPLLLLVVFGGGTTKQRVSHLRVDPDRENRASIVEIHLLYRVPDLEQTS
jgi:hypothetical protein